MRVVFWMGAAALALSLGACDAGPSASKGGAPPTASSAPGASAASASTAPGQSAAVDPRDAPVPPAADGKPLWAPNRKHTAQENADYQFGQHGKEFGAASEADFVAKVHAFVDAPPTGVQKYVRSNGDDLLYDPKTNTFAVVTKAGAPRTMFKPHDGANYWREQVSRESARDKGDSGASSES